MAAFSEPPAGAGHNYADKEASWSDFKVSKSNPSGNIVRFTVDDPKKLITTYKMLRSVLGDAIDQFITTERSDLDTNGDTNIKGSDDYDAPGDGFKDVAWDFNAGYAELTLSSMSSIDASTDMTASKPYADVV